MSELEQGNSGGIKQPPLHRRIPRWLLWMTVAAISLTIVFVAVLAWVAHNAAPLLRQRVIANLEDRFQTHVELDELRISVLKGLVVTGSGLRIDAPPAETEEAATPASPNLDPTPSATAAPHISVRSFSFRTGVRQLLEPAMRIDSVRVDGLRIRIPPKEQSPAEESSATGAPAKKKKHNLLARLHIPSKAANSAAANWKIVVDQVLCRDVILTIETDKPGKQPLVFPIRDITLHNVGRGAPMPFEAHLINAVPVGDIASTGHIGPWVPDDPRQTPVDGSYTFTNANLGPIKGIAGILSSTGNYSGILGRIDVTGSTDTPDFSLDTAQHTMPLHTDFNATVDGTTGDTILNSVHATLLHTVLDVQGSVIRANVPTGLTRAKPFLTPQSESGQTLDQATRTEAAIGHIIRISVQSDRARIEDLLTLGVRTTPPLMNGAMTLRAHLTIPPGTASVADKMRVDGSFTIRDATFSNPQWQQTLDSLSARASGDAEKAKRGDAQNISTQMDGNFALASAVLNVPKLHFEMPGAAVDVAGNYSLDGDTFDFAGTARTDATASQMLTGWKSILTKPFDKLLEKNGAGVEVPVTISGTRSAPKFGVDAGKLLDQIKARFKKGGENDQDQTQQEQQSGQQTQPPDQTASPAAAPPSR